MSSASLFKPPRPGTAKFISNNKLTDDDVLDIRSKLKQKANLLKYISENLSVEAIAKEYKISVRSVKGISSGESWKHLQE